VHYTLTLWQHERALAGQCAWDRATCQPASAGLGGWLLAWLLAGSPTLPGLGVSRLLAVEFGSATL
jgi:hypothetical protein